MAGPPALSHNFSGNLAQLYRAARVPKGKLSDIPLAVKLEMLEQTRDTSKLTGDITRSVDIGAYGPQHTVDSERCIDIVLSRAFSSSCSCCRLGDKSQKPGLHVERCRFL